MVVGSTRRVGAPQHRDVVSVGLTPIYPRPEGSKTQPNNFVSAKNASGGNAVASAGIIKANLIYDCQFEEGNDERHVMVLASDVKTARKLALGIVKKEGRNWDISGETVPVTAMTFDGDNFGLIYNNNEAMAIVAA